MTDMLDDDGNPVPDHYRECSICAAWDDPACMDDLAPDDGSEAYVCSMCLTGRHSSE